MAFEARFLVGEVAALGHGCPSLSLVVGPVPPGENLLAPWPSSVTLIGAGLVLIARLPWNGFDSRAPFTDGVPVEGAGRLQSQSLWQPAVARGSNRDDSAPA